MIVLVTLTIPSLAQSGVTLDDNAIKTFVIGKTLLGIYADDSQWRETYFVDAGLDYQDVGGRFTGTWTVTDQQLCTFYDDDALDGGCFAVVKRSSNCVDFYPIDPATGTTFVSAALMAAGIGWHARGWRSDQPSTCETSVVS